MITIDGKTYNVEITALGLDIEFMYKFAERAENFELQYELGAVFYNQSITFAPSGTENEDYVKLIGLLSTKSSIDEGTGHNVETVTPFGRITFLMYPNAVHTDLLHNTNQGSWWTGTTVKFIAVKPAERW